jgi:hypothetical protein
MEVPADIVKDKKKRKKAKKIKRGKNKSQIGGAFLNNLIEKLPYELHLPSYSYCGPGTHLKKRLEANIPPKNKLDSLCQTHDIFYDKHKNLSERHIADKILRDGAAKIARSSEFD